MASIHNDSICVRASDAISPASAGPGRPAVRVPGEPGIWVLIALELTIFSLVFGGYIVTWAGHQTDFTEAALTHVRLGTLNTVVLLTSSLTAAIGAGEIARGRPATAHRALVATLALGLAFVVVKSIEYGQLLADGHAPTTSEYWMYYFVLTGLHLMHVAVGLGALALALRWLRDAVDATAQRHATSAICYWHMVDLLWVVIFSLLYLTPR